ncbi:restriction endonuclease [Lederbergia citrea]|uniref:restriction endonuclease n=1 Tax=Lederbergia citrea TaxID=2833581 RepID=UPI001BC940B1|nr:restriction endonuclease [Lederbergia citrea]MBS4176987.1 restriction endonuclease [Lederbergia citrea]MBS4203561.1 restriction endonuclease [Lederbergia citrea]
MSQSKFLNKTKLSERAGLPESTGRKYISDFQNYFPVTQKNNSIFFKVESIHTLKAIKLLKQNGLSNSKISDYFQENGVPENSNEFEALVNQYRININDGIPHSKEIMTPFLEILSDGKEHTSSEILNLLAIYFNLNEEQRLIRHENSKDYKFTARIRGTRHRLRQMDFIEEVGQSSYCITTSGLNFLKKSNNKKPKEVNLEAEDEIIDPIDLLKDTKKQIDKELAQSIIKKIKSAHWSKLEKIVLSLLEKMGYGEGELTVSGADKGIDGKIKEDKLGLDKIYVQAKRWEDSVGAPELQRFSGALDGEGVKKGVFITTSYFTQPAIEYVNRLESKTIVLIDGERLAELMIEYGIGVTEKEYFILKKIDHSFFNEE